ncbi:zinc ribbon domain-containing protein [Dickeya lacustris]
MMLSETYCPACQQPMSEVAEAQYRCEGCKRQYQRALLCPDCAQPLQVLAGCGSKSYWCANGHGLISRTRIHVHYQDLA